MRLASFVLVPTLLAGTSVVSGCNCFRPQQQLADFRPLGIESDPIIPRPNATVRLRLVTADARNRPVTVRWYRCPQTLLPDIPGIPIDVDAGADAGATIDDCFRATPFAEGASAEFVPTTSPDSRMTLVAFACAGGTIGPPEERSAWPTCRGEGARGYPVIKTLPLTPPSPVMPEIDRFAIRDVTFDGTAWSETDVRTVPRCRGDVASCPRHRIGFATSLFAVGQELPLGPGGSVSDYVVTAASTVNTDDNGVSSRCPLLPTIRSDGTFDWIAPDAPGDVKFHLFSQFQGIAFAHTERTIRVE